MSDKYILNEAGEPEACEDLMAWGKSFQDSDKRRVARHEADGVTVSTVFLGLDHSWGDGPPVLWETLIFEGPRDGEMERCSGSRADALAMHERVVASLNQEKP